MSPDELQAEQIRRLQQDIRDLEAAHAEIVRVLREERLRDLEAFNARAEKTESRLGLYVMVLVGFAFTVAASAVGLAFSLGGPS